MNDPLKPRIRVRHAWVGAPLGNITTRILHVWIEVYRPPEIGNEGWEPLYGTGTEGQRDKVKEWLEVVPNVDFLAVWGEYLAWAEKDRWETATE